MSLPDDLRALASSGFTTCLLAATSEQDERGDEQRARSEERAPDHLFPEHLVLLDDDRYVAAADGEHLRLYRHEDLREQVSAPPCASVRLGAALHHLSAVPARAYGAAPAVVVALGDRSIRQVTLPDGGSSAGERPQERVLCDDVGGEVRILVRTARDLLVLVDTGEAAGPVLLEVDVAAGRILRRARVPLAQLISVAPLDPAAGEPLLAVDARHGAHLVQFAPGRDGAELEVTPLDPALRVTAAVALDDRWVAVARKGGEVVQVANPSSPQRPQRAQGSNDTAATCRRLRELLRVCGCGCALADPCGCGRPCGCHGGHEPGGTGDPGGPGGPSDPAGPGGPGGPGDPGQDPVDDEPCERRRRAELGWTVGALHRVGGHLVAVSSRGDRLAVLDERLDVVVERFLGRRRTRIATGDPSTDRMLVARARDPQVEVWSLADYVRRTRAVDQQPSRPGTDPAVAALASPVVFHGQRTSPGTANPHLRVAVFTVTEPGQSFTDPDQARMQALLEPRVYGVARDYYRENSFGTLQTEFSVFGVHLGTPRRPLVLPRPVASYFYDEFTPGGVRAVMPASWASPLRLDGTESLTLRSAPAVGTGRDYAVPFAALWTTRTHDAYPVAVTLTGTETLQLEVEDQTGSVHTLAVNFSPLTLNHAQGDDEAAFLAALGAHVTGAIRAAESAAGIPQLVQDVVFRRIRTNDDDTRFGRLQGQLRVRTGPGATSKGRVDITVPGGAPAGLQALGLTGTGDRSGVLDSRTAVVAYLRECLDAAQRDAGEGPGLDDPHLSSAVEAVEDAAAQTLQVTVRLSSDKGGAGASASVLSSSGLTASGWSTATPRPGSTSNANNRNTMRDHQDLADDVFTAAMDHLRATGPWDAEAVRAEFAQYDAMMIGFVGACPPSVPVAERWGSADPVDFARLRMFVRYHQARDRNNPDPSSPPVTMGTTLLIGQTFNAFDPGLMSHEIGHGLGLPDLYPATGFRDDVAYVDRWCQMAGGNSRFNHFCGWSKWAVGWIVESTDPATNRVVDVPMPAPAAVTTTEAWLVPVEHWDATMRADVVAAVGPGPPVGQLMKVHLGSDGGVVDLVELRSRGQVYSQQLPPTPAVVVTNVLQPGTDRRWAVNGLYRRDVHLLNDGDELTAVGDTWDFAAGQEFPLKGCRVAVVDLQTIRGGTVPICRLRVEREPAEFLDLHFQDNVPSWRSPDIWVDWRGDNPDPAAPRLYPVGTPTDQGEVVRFPGSGVEPHFLVARPHNAGNVTAEDVKVRWFICDPPGAGDDGRWAQRDTRTLPQVAGGGWEPVAFDWGVTSGTRSHQCIRAEIIDWTIPSTVDPATGDTVALSSDDVRLQNNMAQKNVFDFEAAT